MQLKSETKMKSILITGGTGLIGLALIKKLLDSNYKVSVLSRGKKSPHPDVDLYHWDVHAAEIDMQAVGQADVIVHLAGAGIAEKRWTKNRKQEIIHSRVASAELLFKKVNETGKKLEAFISSSAVGWYGGLSNDNLMTEDLPAADGFMGQTCRLWEEAVDLFQTLGVRTVKIRTGVVLSTDSGALPKMALPVKIGLGSALGSGKQIVPWIHIDDIVGIYLKAIQNAQMQGVFNGVAPAENNLNIFMRTLAKTLGKPYFMPSVPAFALKVAMGEMAVLVTEGSRISALKIQEAGYEFKFQELDKALAELYLENWS